MPNIMPVSMQDFLYCWKPDLREQVGFYYKNLRGCRTQIVCDSPFRCIYAGLWQKICVT